ncbi:MAG: branched-chain amino acid ABC transporter permease [Nitrospirota bacterium]
MMDRLSRPWLAPIWLGLLAWPLVGWPRAGYVAAWLAGALGAWWLLSRAVRSGGAQSTLGRVSQALHRVRLRLAGRQTPRRLIYGGGLALLLIGPLFLNNYNLDVLTLAGIYIVLALGLNIVVGLAGLLDLGYIAFYAIGAYCYALLSTHWGVPFWAGLPLGGLAAAAFGVLLGTVTLRLRGDYLAIVTLGFIHIVHLVLNNWDSVTNGPNGILNIGRPAIGDFVFSRPIHFYYLILAIVVAAAFAVRRLDRSRIGRAWMAIREDEIAAEAMGVDTTRFKTLAFALGAAWAGVAGVFFAGKFAFVSPESFTFFESVIVLAMVVLGGLGSIPGVILGASVIVLLPELLREFQDYRMLVFGAALIGVMIFRPQGLLGGASHGHS